MGSIRRSPSGKWEARYRDALGRHRSKSFSSKTAARSYLSAVETELERGDWIDPNAGRITLAEYAMQWVEGEAQLRASSRANLDSRLRLHIIPRFGSHPLNAITPAEVRQWVADLSKRLSPGSVASTYRTLARILSTAQIEGRIRRSPCVGIRLPKQTSHTEMHFLTPREVSLLADALDDRYRTLIFTAAYTGMRWGELAGLRTKRVNLKSGFIRVTEAQTEVNGHVATGPTKTGAHRTIALPPFLTEMLERHINEFASPEGVVFTSAEGTSIRRNFYHRHFKPAVRRAGLPAKLRFHDLRHTCAALLIAQGAHPKEIQERMGHSTIKLTFDRYGHLFPTLDSRLRDGLEATFRDADVEPVDGPDEGPPIHGD